MKHEWAIDEREYLRHERRRSRRHAFSELRPERTALLVVDMIRFFVDENPYAQGIVPNIQHLARATRSAGGSVVWILPANGAPAAARVEFLGPEIADRYQQSGGTGSLHSRMWHEFEVADRDFVIEKRTHGAFDPGGSELDALLRERGVDTVVVAGTVANVCCESTVREAAALGYRTVMVADAHAALTDRDLNATLHTVYRSFGDVRPVVEIVGLLSETKIRSDSH